MAMHTTQSAQHTPEMQRQEQVGERVVFECRGAGRLAMGTPSSVCLV